MVECALKGQKLCVLVLLLLQSVICRGISTPRALPWADIFLPLWGVPSHCQSHFALNADGGKGARDDEIFLPDTSKKNFTKKVSKNKEIAIGACRETKRRTRSLSTPHAKFAISPREVAQHHRRNLAEKHA
jgi:hypothetical protein